jgi:hypothetical protein
LSNRPPCPNCATPVATIQYSKGVVAMVPCLCWVAPEDALDVESELATGAVFTTVKEGQ